MRLMSNVPNLSCSRTARLTIGAKVGAGLFGVFLALALFRPGRHQEDKA